MSDACEMPLENATPAEVREILTTAKTIAVVGLRTNRIAIVTEWPRICSVPGIESSR